MKIICKDIKLYENKYKCMGGWYVYTYDLDYSFEFENNIIKRKIRWMQNEISFHKRFLSNSKGLIKSIKKDVKLYFKEQAINFENIKYKESINSIMDEFNSKKEITIEI